MSLSCTCDDDDSEWSWYEPDDYSIMPKFPRRRRCCSCRTLIDPGAIVLCFARDRYDDWKGEDVELAPYYMCEPCGDQYYNLTDLGYCIDLGGDNMHHLLQEYVELQKDGR